MSRAKPDDFRDLTCRECENAASLDFDFTMAFQPIVDLERRETFAHEALVRGPGGEPARSVLAQVDSSNRYRFDQSCRVKAVKLAAELGMESRLSINFLPNAIYKPESCIRTTLAATREYGFPQERVIFEVTEGEDIGDPDHLRHIFQYYRECGFTTAIDDFGAGYAGLSRLAEFQPDLIKLDMGLIRDVDSSPTRQAICQGVATTCRALAIDIIAEGVETEEELRYLYGLGIRRFQGFLFARPALRQLPAVTLPVL
ncbi:MAG: EAL domain-containing protein [Pseudohaliea sp.]